MKHSIAFVSLIFFSSFIYASQQIIIEPDQGQEPLEWIISHAQKSIDLSIYQFMDSSGKVDNVVAALANARQRGVAVTILMNNFADSDWPADGAKVLKFEEDWCQFNNITCIPSSTGFTYTHYKYFIIDGNQIDVMTMNISPEDFDGTTRNFIVQDTKPADVQFAQNLFHTDLANTKDNTKKSPPVPENFALSPVNSVSATDNLINSAKYSLDIYAMYFASSCPQQVLNAIIDAAKRGVQVRIITNNIEDTPTIIASLMAQSPNIKAIILNENKDNFFIHAKVIIADYKTVLSGSINMSYTSYNENRELSIDVNGPVQAHKFEDTFNVDWQRFRSA